MTDDQLAFRKDRAEAAFRLFQKFVKTASPSVPAETTQGQWFARAEGKKLGLVDRIGDLNFAHSVLRRAK